MHNLIKNIIIDPQNRISIGNCFDSHLIIQLIIENYSDDYFQFASKYSGAGKSGIASVIHSQIAIQMKELTKGIDAILEQKECRIVSYNIHHKISENTLWKRIK